MTPDAALGVFFADRRVGTLEFDAESDRLLFLYDPSWLRAPDRFAISASLPLREGPHEPPVVRAFFANLLPEGEVRQGVARRLGLSESNDFALLRALGGDCAGALSLMEEKAPDAGEPEESSDPPLSLEALGRMARAGGALSRVGAQGRIRLSLAGAQEKLPVRYQGGEFFLPSGKSASTHIVKFPNRSYKQLPTNELFSTLLAADLGLETCRCELVRVQRESVLVVSRYDRANDGGNVVRLHQEDFCQALGLPPSRKYEEEGGPSFAACVRVVTEISANPARDVEALIRWIVFCALLGNADGHGKNLSLLRHGDGRWRLAPFYDLVCTAAYPQLERYLAMHVGSTNDPGQIGAKDWEQLAIQSEIRPRVVLDVVHEMAGSIEGAVDKILGRYRDTYGASAFLAQLPSLIRRRCRRLRRLLSE
jgi:serine/threonine-protein kinase HipA